MNANHEEMCKVKDRQDDVYEKIIEVVRKMVKGQGGATLNRSL